MTRKSDIRSLSGDIGGLRSSLKRIVGEPFRFIRESYGDELTLHMGGLVSYETPREKGKTRGSIILGTRASSWILESGCEPGAMCWSEDLGADFATTEADLVEMAALERRPLITTGSLVTSATPVKTGRGLGLMLTFSDGSRLDILPSTVADAESDEIPDRIQPDRTIEVDTPLADWEIFLPGYEILKAGPGLTWTLSDSRGNPPGEIPA